MITSLTMLTSFDPKTGPVNNRTIYLKFSTVYQQKKTEKKRKLINRCGYKQLLITLYNI